jgi:hypothetical protein
MGGGGAARRCPGRSTLDGTWGASFRIPKLTTAGRKRPPRTRTVSWVKPDTFGGALAQDAHRATGAAPGARDVDAALPDWY